MYKMNEKVRYSECGANGKIKLPFIINYFQDCTTEHSDSLGVGLEYTKKKKRAWILNSWQIIINRYPKVHEEIEVSTWPTGFQRVFGTRNFSMKTSEGEVLAFANTLWVYMDMENGRPSKPDEEELSHYTIGEPLKMEYAPRKIKVPEELNLIDTMRVRKYHIDTNGHMNNSQYVQIAAEYLPEGYFIGEVRVEYKKSAVFGDVIVIKKSEEEKRIVVTLSDEAGVTYAIVEFLGEDK